MSEARPSREHLYLMIERGIEYALLTYAGFTEGGARRDGEAWRTAPMPDLMSAVMQQLRAGLSPALSSEAVEAGVLWVRENVPADLVEAAQLASKGIQGPLSIEGGAAS